MPKHYAPSAPTHIGAGCRAGRALCCLLLLASRQARTHRGALQARLAGRSTMGCRSSVLLWRLAIYLHQLDAVWRTITLLSYSTSKSPRKTRRGAVLMSTPFHLQFTMSDCSCNVGYHRVRCHNLPLCPYSCSHRPLFPLFALSRAPLPASVAPHTAYVSWRVERLAHHRCRCI